MRTESEKLYIEFVKGHQGVTKEALNNLRGGKDQNDIKNQLNEEVKNVLRDVVAKFVDDSLGKEKDIKDICNDLSAFGRACMGEDRSRSDGGGKEQLQGRDAPMLIDLVEQVKQAKTILEDAKNNLLRPERGINDRPRASPKDSRAEQLGREGMVSTRG